MHIPTIVGGWEILVISVGHTAWAPEGHKGQGQGVQRASTLNLEGPKTYSVNMILEQTLL